MGTLSLSALSLACPRRLHHYHHLFPLKAYLSNPISSPHLSLQSLKSAKTFTKTVVLVGNSSDPKESLFKDEDGVIDDMDGYLNYLSLEYDSVWDTKPAWCQPWTITLTGVSVIGCSWLILHSVVITTIVLSLISLWWYIFLYSYPKAYSDMIAERRKRVTNGVEDTYGWEKGQ